MLAIVPWVYSSICVAVITLLLFVYIAGKLYDKYCSRLEDQRGSYALITGCGSGFGNSAAHELNRRGIHVFAACHTSHAVQVFSDDVTFKGTAFLMDVTKQEDIETVAAMIKNAVKEKGLHILFNNAGFLQVGPIELLTKDELQKCSNVNLWGTINVTTAMLPMIKIARGRIINITSVLGRMSIPYMAPYCISKYGLEAFSDSLRHEMKPWGVGVHIIESGFTRTNIYRQGDNQYQVIWDRQSKETKDTYGESFINETLRVSKASNIDKVASEPHATVDAYIHAALSTRPRLRYLIGVDAHIIATIALLPTRIGDFISEHLQRHSGLQAALPKQ